MRQWIRSIQLTVSGSGGAIDLSAMRIRFDVRQWTTQSPNNATIRVYNLADSTTARFLNMEFQEVDLQAGYESHIGRIFKGTIAQTKRGRESPTDTYLDILAKDGDTAHNWAIANRTFAPGSTPQDHYDYLLQTMQQFGIVKGYITNGVLDQPKFPRAVMMYGMSRDYLRNIANSITGTWNIHNGALNMITAADPGNGGPYVMNSRTGMIGMPVQTQNGILVRALINPDIGLDSQLKIDETSIQKQSFNLSFGGEPFNAEPYIPAVAADGLYRILAIDWVGDNRGVEWYMDMACIAANGGVAPPSQVNLGRQ
jgi:hypothetical protein